MKLHQNLAMTSSGIWEQHLRQVSDDDVNGLIAAGKTYGPSWRRRGGVGAFMMLARKWDRIERAVQNTVEEPMKTDQPWDIFAAAERKPPDADQRGGVLEDIMDLRRYLLLVEAFTRYRLNRLRPLAGGGGGSAGPGGEPSKCDTILDPTWRA